VHALSKRLLASVMRQRESNAFSPLLGAFAFLATITLTVPVEWLVVVGTLTSRRRWVSVALYAATGSALASLGLYFAFHHLGWSLLLGRYPELAGTRAWLQATDWLSRFGSLAVFALMALPLPLPKLPMLAVAGIYRLPIPEVAAAIWFGKAIKYTGYAYIVVRFPGAICRLLPPKKEKFDVR